ncbi:translation initiation factor IF-3 [Clostridium fungisolvens]|uniref:Translation initiation factor IF-3 n=1 Tax=Clostridium fungisolvens TaxID=1604897 RepID=A0A6V8SIY6_9CLOT|nr:Translation initiation factor IF-3 [Clostridium fungisolvens]
MLIILEVLYINKNLDLNENIRSKEIRLSGENSQIMKTEDALRLAREQNLDLVMISPTAVPPVCRIMDYSKHLYEQSKKQKEAKKNQKVVELKEVRLSPTIEEHDIDIKCNNAKKFLSSGNKVKVSVRFRGRQNNATGTGSKILEIFINKIGDLGVIEKSAQFEGRNMFIIIAPKTSK